MIISHCYARAFACVNCVGLTIMDYSYGGGGGGEGGREEVMIMLWTGQS